MADRSSDQGKPDDWSRGSYPIPERYYSTEPTEAYSPGTPSSRPAGAADPFGTETTGGYGAGNAGPSGAGNAGPSGAATADRYRAGNADPFAAQGADPFGSRNADPFGAETASAYGAGTPSAYGAGTPSAYGSGTPSAHGAGTANTYGAGTPNAYGAGTPNAYGAGTPNAYGAGTARTDGQAPTAATGPSAGRGTANSKGFLAALFDFGFRSFVTPTVIKVLYVLILISTVISALAFTIAAFKVSAVFGLLTLVIGDPLFVIIVLAIYRIILEFFIVVFRMSEDIQSIRERGDLR